MGFPEVRDWLLAAVIMTVATVVAVIAETVFGLPFSDGINYLIIIIVLAMLIANNRLKMFIAVQKIRLVSYFWGAVATLFFWLTFPVELIVAVAFWRWLSG